MNNQDIFTTEEILKVLGTLCQEGMKTKYISYQSITISQQHTLEKDSRKFQRSEWPDIEYKINIFTVYEEIKEEIENMNEEQESKTGRKNWKWTNNSVLLEVNSITMEIKNQWKLIMEV